MASLRDAGRDTVTQNQPAEMREDYAKPEGASTSPGAPHSFPAYTSRSLRFTHSPHDNPRGVSYRRRIREGRTRVRGINHIHRISSVKRNQRSEFMRFSVLTTQSRQKRSAKHALSKRSSAKTALSPDSAQFPSRAGFFSKLLMHNPFRLNGVFLANVVNTPVPTFVGCSFSDAPFCPVLKRICCRMDRGRKRAYRGGVRAYACSHKAREAGARSGLPLLLTQPTSAHPRRRGA